MDLDKKDRLRGLGLYLKEGSVFSIGDSIKIQITEVEGKTCKIIIDADPKAFPVHRLFKDFRDIKERGGIQ